MLSTNILVKTAACCINAFLEIYPNISKIFKVTWDFLGIFLNLWEIGCMAELKHMTCQNISECWDFLLKNCLFWTPFLGFLHIVVGNYGRQQ